MSFNTTKYQGRINMKIEMMVEGLNVIFSEKTIDALIEHQCCVLASSDRLARYDPRCKLEKLILDDVCRYFNKDVEVTAEKLSLKQYGNFYEKFDDNELEEYFSNLIAILKGAKNSYCD
jgi:hypothetical protein